MRLRGFLRQVLDVGDGGDEEDFDAAVGGAVF